MAGMRWVSASAENGCCVEVAEVACDSSSCVEVRPCTCGDVLIRNSKDPDGPVLRFNVEEWRVFAQGVRDGVFDQIGASS